MMIFTNKIGPLKHFFDLTNGDMTMKGRKSHCSRALPDITFGPEVQHFFKTWTPDPTNKGNFTLCSTIQVRSCYIGCGGERVSK